MRACRGVSDALTESRNCVRVTEETSTYSLMDKLRYHERGYTAVEAAIASALIGDPARAVQEPIEEFARRIGVSAGSVVRFSRLMGFPGYRALKYALARQADSPATEVPPQRGDLSSFLDGHARAVQFAATSVSTSEFRLAAELLSAASEIDIVGVGASSATARAAEFLLTTAGLRCRRLEDPHEGAAAAAFLGDRGVLLCVSHSGRTKATVDAAGRARTGGASVIAICSFARSPLVETATHSLVVEASRTRYAADEARFRTAHLAIVHALVEAAGKALEPHDLGLRRSRWASGRFDLRYDRPETGDDRSSFDSQTLTN